MPSLESLDQHIPEVQDILGSPPRRIIRYGMGFLASLALLLIVLAWWIRYPDILTIPCTLTADAPAVSLSAPFNARLVAILSEDKQKVRAGQPVAVLDDDAQYESVLRVRQLLADTDLQNPLKPMINLKLGELQSSFRAYQKAQADLRFFYALHYHERKIKALRQKLASSMRLREHMANQAQFLEKDAQLGQRVFSLDSTLFARRALTPYEFVNSERTHVQEQSGYWQSKSSLVTAEVQLDELRQAIVELQLDQRQKEREYHVARDESYRNLLQRLDEWERKNVITSPTTGTITFNTVRAVNMPVKAGEVIATVVPMQTTRMFCKARLPIAGSGKVQPGQRVQLHFDNYPASEFGTIPGQVHTIALTPGENGYLLLIDLPQGMQTSHGNRLPYKHDITGTADVITADRRLLERLLANLTRLLHHS